MRQRVGDLRADQRHLVGIQAIPLVEHRPQALSVDELHHDERGGAPAPVVDADDVRMVQPGRGPRLALEPLGGARRDLGGRDLDRHRALEEQIAAAVDLAHAARTDAVPQLVAVGVKFRDGRHVSHPTQTPRSHSVAAPRASRAGT